jgi:predicted nucleic-acid-binding Zn-ribbon protein
MFTNYYQYRFIKFKKEKLEMDNITILGKENSQKFNIGIKYILVQCLSCGATWGVSLSIFEGVTNPVTLVCRVCASNKALESIKQ